MHFTDTYYRMAEQLNTKEFERLFRAHYTRLCFYAYDYVGDIDIARDIVSDAFTRLWNEREQLKDTAKLNNYLLVCVRNRCINDLRKKHHTIPIDLIDERVDCYDMEWLEAQEERIAEVNKVIDSMSDKTQRVLQECYFNNCTYKETAAMLGITPDGVKKHITKAFSMLRAHFKTVKGLKMLLQLPFWLNLLLYI